MKENIDRSKPQLLLSEKEAAQALSVSTSMLQKLRKRRAIPFVQIGRSVKYEPAALEQWVRTKLIFAEPSRN